MAEEKKEYELFVPEEEHEFMHEFTRHLCAWTDNKRGRALKELFMKKGEELFPPGEIPDELEKECLAAAEEFWVESNAVSAEVAKRMFHKWLEVSPFFAKGFVETFQVELKYGERFLKRLLKIKKELKKNKVSTQNINRAISAIRAMMLRAENFSEHYTEYVENARKKEAQKKEE